MLKTICLPLKELAADLDVPYTTAKNWSAGRTEIPPEYRDKLATFVEGHAEELQALARELREVAGEGE